MRILPTNRRRTKNQKRPFIFEVTVLANDNLNFTTVINENSGLVTINYGDGTPQTTSKVHTFPNAGIYTVEIKSDLVSFCINNNVIIKNKISKFVQYGDLDIEKLNFWGCINLTTVTTLDSFPTTLTDISNLFRGCTNLLNIHGVTNWNTTNVTDMSYVFYQNSQFNQSINWNTSSCTNMAGMFSYCNSFNSSFSLSDTSNVTDFSLMFKGCSVFNQQINFNTTASTTFRQMFYGATNFNQPLNFVTPNLTDLTRMFTIASSFNSSLLFSDTSNVTSLTAMFNGATAFNQPLNWDTSSVTIMYQFLRNAVNFNQPINWNTLSCTNMFSAFEGCSALNSSFVFSDVSNVTDMSNMFYNATVFNQNLTAWVTKIGVTHTNFETNSALAPANLPTFN